MGQLIEVTTTVVDGDVVMLDTDRSITGQGGAGYDSAAAAADDGRFPGRLASSIFAADDDVDHVFVGSNGVVVRRSTGWDDAAMSALSGTVSEFFLHYDADAPGAGEAAAGG